MRDKWTPWKARFTKAQKAGDQAVLDTWDEFHLFCRDEGWPDWWSQVERVAHEAFLRHNDIDFFGV